MISEEIRSQSIEIRLLAVKKNRRGSLVTLKLMTQAGNLAISLGYKYALISAIEAQIPLYLKFGFKQIAPPKNVRGVYFTPMILGLNEFEYAISKNRVIAKFLILNRVNL